MGLPNQSLESLRPLSEPELEEWEDAYAAVEAYLGALHIRNRLLVAELVRGILWRASARRAREPESTARKLAMEEMLTEIGEWTEKVLDEPLLNRRLAARGRLALLLAGMPDRWQGVFLTPAPWPEEFVAAMRSSYLAAGPNFAELTMVPKPLELNVIGSGAAQWWETMDRRPIVRIMFLSLVTAVIGSSVWFIFFD